MLYDKTKVALITGGTMGIGAALAKALQDQFTVVICSRSIHERSIQCDVSDENDVARMFKIIHGHYGRLDVLVNNAAVYSRGSIANMSPIIWREMIGINLNGVFNCCHHAIPLMMENNYGRIVNVVSYAMQYLPPERAAYSASKMAVAVLTATLAKEISGNIKINCVCPGACKTRMDLDQKATRVPSEAIPDLIKLVTLPDNGPTGLAFKNGKEWQIFP